MYVFEEDRKAVHCAFIVPAELLDPFVPESVDSAHPAFRIQPPAILDSLPKTICCGLDHQMWLSIDERQNVRPEVCGWSSGGGDLTAPDTRVVISLHTACYGLKLSQRFVSEPLVKEIVLSSEVDSKAMWLYILLKHPAVLLTWAELEPLCAAAYARDEPCMYAALRQGAEGLLANAQKEYTLSQVPEWRRQTLVPALLQDFVRLGVQYHLPGLVDLGMERSLSLVPNSLQEAHFRDMPAEVQSLAQLVLRDPNKTREDRRESRERQTLWATLAQLAVSTSEFAGKFIVKK